MLRLYLVRHGQTDFSAENRFCGGLDPCLNQEGLHMAEFVTHAFQSIPLQAIYTSPSLRAKQTAQGVADQHQLPLQQEEGLREIAYGLWEGLSLEEIQRNDPKGYAWWQQDPARHGSPGGETALHIAARADLVLEKIRATHTEDNVLLVSHKATLRVLMCLMLGIDVRSYRDRFDYPVAAMTCVEWRPRGPFFKSIADVSHLPLQLRG